MMSAAAGSIRWRGAGAGKGFATGAAPQTADTERASARNDQDTHARRALGPAQLHCRARPAERDYTFIAFSWARPFQI